MRALSIGWHPDVPNPLTPDDVRRGLAAAQEKVAAAGHTLDLCLILGDGAHEALIGATLGRQPYDIVVVGAGIRLQPQHHLLFEKVVNLVHRHAPGAAIGFNTTPIDTADAVLRWV